MPHARRLRIAEAARRQSRLAAIDHGRFSQVDKLRQVSEVNVLRPCLINYTFRQRNAPSPRLKTTAQLHRPWSTWTRLHASEMDVGSALLRRQLPCTLRNPQALSCGNTVGNHDGYTMRSIPPFVWHIEGHGFNYPSAEIKERVERFRTSLCRRRPLHGCLEF